MYNFFQQKKKYLKTSLGSDTISGSLVPFLYLMTKPPFSIRVSTPALAIISIV